MNKIPFMEGKTASRTQPASRGLLFPHALTLSKRRSKTVKKSVLLFVAACLFLSSGSIALAQEKASSRPPKVLQILREGVKPGKGVAHEKIEAAWPHTFASARSPTHYIAMKSVTGPSEARPKMKGILRPASVILFPLTASAAKEENERVETAGKVLQEILDIPDNIPKELLDRAECVIVIPSVKKIALGSGGSYGWGVMSCRTGEKFTGPWSAPAMYRLEGGSFGLQLGGQATDFVLLVMNPKGADSLLKTKVNLGGDASAAAGPKGRTATAATDAYMQAEILTYSRNRGLFAGVSLEGSTLRPDNEANMKLYGKEIDAKDIVLKAIVPPPASAKQLLSILNKESPGTEGGTPGFKPRRKR